MADITQIVRLEQHVRQHQRLEAVGALAAGIAHELNNPLNGIMNYAELIKEDTAPDSSTHHFADEILAEGRRVSSVALNLLRFSRQDRSPAAPIDMASVVKGALQLTSSDLKKDRVRVELKLVHDMPPVCVRAEQIQQALLNLIVNAREALNEKSGDNGDGTKSITIGLTKRDDPDGTWVRTSVIDNGAGIPPGAQPFVFSPFFTTKSRSRHSGMGLNVAYNIVKDHGGRVAAETLTDGRTAVHIDLPPQDCPNETTGGSS